MSKVGLAVWASLECMPKELAQIIGEYAKSRPVKFRYGNYGVDEDNYVSEDGRRIESKGDAKRQICGVGRDRFLDTPFSWMVQVRGESWQVGIMNHLGHTRGFTSTGSLSPSHDLIGGDIQAPLRHIGRFLKSSNLSLSNLVFDLTLTVDEKGGRATIAMTINQIRLEGNPKSKYRLIKIQEAIKQMVGKSQAITTRQYIDSCFPYVSFWNQGYAHLLDAE